MEYDFDGVAHLSPGRRLCMLIVFFATLAFVASCAVAIAQESVYWGVMAWGIATGLSLIFAIASPVEWAKEGDG